MRHSAAYWWELWRRYEARFGDARTMDAALYSQLTGHNMRKAPSIGQQQQREQQQQQDLLLRIELQTVPPNSFRCPLLFFFLRSF